MDVILKTQGPMLIRYFLLLAASYLMTNGAISAEQHSYIGGQADVIVGAIVAIGTVLYGMWRKPSPAAMDVAEEIDRVGAENVKQDHPIAADPVIIVETPPGQQNLVVPVK
jgi:hypothetical protein